jgi:hypothetical protein
MIAQSLFPQLWKAKFFPPKRIMHLYFPPAPHRAFGKDFQMLVVYSAFFSRKSRDNIFHRSVDKFVDKLHVFVEKLSNLGSLCS